MADRFAEGRSGIVLEHVAGGWAFRAAREEAAYRRGIDAARHAALLKEYGLDRPVLVQYGIYIGRVLQGDLGKSMITQEPVLSEFGSLFPATIELAFTAGFFAMLFGVPWSFLTWDGIAHMVMPTVNLALFKISLVRLGHPPRTDAQ